MSIIRSIIISFSLYSRIPMPVFTWNEDDMKHAIAFLPLVGGVIGLISFALMRMSVAVGLPVICVTLFLTAVPLIVTGGFHLDGFMDVRDAKNSFQSREKKLEIMKDPHIGAFAVISLVTYGLLWLGFLYIITDKCITSGNYKLFGIYCAIFFLARAYCGIGSVFFLKAKKDGMLNMETGKSNMFDKVLLVTEAVVSALFVTVMDYKAGILVTIGITAYLFIYKKSTYDEFGGVTGDTAGYFVVMAEGIVTFLISMYSLFLL